MRGAHEEREIHAVGEVLALAQEALEELGGLWVEGEVFEYRGPYRGSGHYYFKLRDGEAQMDVKLWAGRAARALACELEEGRQVLVHGRFDLWPKRGSLSFVLDRVEDRGAGDLARRFEDLRRRLRAEGLFDPERKRPLPRLPRRVALVTAHPSAAAADVLRTFEERRAPFRVWLRPARVQGEGAVADLCAALAEAARAAPDLILLSRGGGSLEDLWAFNEETLVRAVAASPVPILNAVGHESDLTLCDFAADERAKTPTAAAVLLCEGWETARARLSRLGADLLRGGRSAAQRQRSPLRELRSRLLFQHPARRLERSRNRLENLREAFLRGGRELLHRRGQALLRSARRLRTAGPARRHALLSQRLLGLRPRLQAASPTTLLARGYALVECPGRPGFLRRAAEVGPGDRLRIRLAEGRVDAEVLETGPNEPNRGE